MPGDQRDENRIRDLLRQHGCPMSYHKVRTRMLGAMARPDLAMNPAAVITALWGQEPLRFVTPEHSAEFYRTLESGLWQELLKHKEPDVPFKGVQMPLDPSVANLEVFGMVRMQEIEGFVEGLFNNEEEARLPMRAYDAIMHLGDIRSTMFGLARLIKRASDKRGNDEQVMRLIRHLEILSEVMEAEIHAVFLSCMQAEPQSFAATIAPWQTRH